MKKIDCYDYCELDLKTNFERKYLFGHSEPADDYFNDNLDQYFDEDDYFDYDDNPVEKFALEEKEYTHSHSPAHH